MKEKMHAFGEDYEIGEVDFSRWQHTCAVRLPDKNSRFGSKSVSFNNDWSLMAVGGTEPNTVQLWDVKTRKLECELGGHSKENPECRCNNYFRRMNKVKHGCPVLTGRRDGKCVVALSPDGRYVASAGGFKKWKLRIWDTKTRQKVIEPLGLKYSVHHIEFSPDGSLIAIIYWGKYRNGGAVSVWDMKTCELRFLACRVPIWCIAFSPNSHSIAGGMCNYLEQSSDCSVMIWDVETGNMVTELTGHKNLVWDVTFSSDGSFLASVSSDNVIKLWDLRTQELKYDLQLPSIARNINYEALTLNHNGSLIGVALQHTGSGHVPVVALIRPKTHEIEFVEICNKISGLTTVCIAFKRNGQLIVYGQEASCESTAVLEFTPTMEREEWVPLLFLGGVFQI